MSPPPQGRARPLRRVVVCPQEFKGSLDAFAATRALARGVRAAVDDPTVEVIERPMADGGPGTAAILAAALGATEHRARVRGAYGAEVEAAYYLAPPAPGSQDGPLAIIESAAAVGLSLTDPAERDPAFSSSEGVGHLLLDALAAGARAAIVCVGGTATVDGGSGLARALGMRLLDRNGVALPPGGMHLARLARVEPPAEGAVRHLRVRVAVDAQNVLAGPEGATAVYGAQKGLRDWQAPALDAAMAHWARTVREQLGREIDVPGAGTGGGITAGLLAAIPAASVESGAALVADLVGLRDLVGTADLVVTGEGSLDAQTAYGKTVGHVAALAAAAGVPCLAVAGIVQAHPADIEDVEPLVTDPANDAAVQDALADAGHRAAEAARRLVHRWLGHHVA